ncbi:MAG: hypothetical protein AABX73_02085, partial [Nanoarchaeota archaeon]
MHKKYTSKNGRLYGPYLYENKRINGKVVTRYVGKHTPSKLPFLFYLAAFFVIALVLFLVYNYYESSPTGRVSFELGIVYKPGEKLDGDLRFRIKEGELVPKDSKVFISYGNQSKELELSELVRDKTISGTFYAENSDINGEGEGYGIVGSKVIYPKIDFEMLFYTPSESPKEETPEDKKEEKIEEKEEKAEEKAEEKEEKKDEKTESQATESTASESTTTTTESAPISEESTQTEPSITGGAISETEESGDSVQGQVSYQNNFEYSIQEGQKAKIVSGSVKVNGETIPDNSVSIEISEGKAIASTDYFIDEKGFGEEYLGEYALTLYVDVETLDLYAIPEELEVKLIYGATEIAVHKEKIGISEEEPSEGEPSEKDKEKEPKEKKESKENITLEETNITEINVTDANVTTNISNLVLLNEIPTVRISFNGQTSFNLSDYFFGAESYSISILNIDAKFEGDVVTLTPEADFKGARKAKITAGSGTERLDSNEFSILVSSGAVSITTSRKKIVVGQPVKWEKNVSLETPENITVEIPVIAENITVKKIEGDIITETEPAIVSTQPLLTGGAITGEVVIELDLKKESRFVSWFKNLFRRIFRGISGRVITDLTQQSNVTQIVLEGDATEYVIEYETEAPEKFERNTSEGRLIAVSGPEELEYTDVIAFEELNNEVPVEFSHRIKVYWYNYEFDEKTEAEIEEAISKKASEVEDEEIIEETNIITQETTIPSEQNKTEDSSVTIESSEQQTNPEVSIETAETDATILGNVVLSGRAITEETNSDVNIEILGEEDIDYKKQEVAFDAYDLDSDGKIDYVEWVVPHLSTQTYEIIIEITKAEHLDANKTFISDIYNEVYQKDDVWSEPIYHNEYVRVWFEKNLTSDKDITVYARNNESSNSLIEVYNYNSTDKIVDFPVINETGYYKIYLTNMNGSSDVFDLRVSNLDNLSGSYLEFDHIIDPPGAGDNNWICSKNSDFTNTTCWSLGAVPVAGDNVTLNATGIGNMNVTNNTVPQYLSSFVVESGYTGRIVLNFLPFVGNWSGPDVGAGTNEWNVTNNISIYGGVINVSADYPFNKTAEGSGQVWRSLNGNITIGSGVTINGQGLGFPASEGPGVTDTANEGGAHGGRAMSHAAVLNPRNVYGNASAPITPGSGGTHRAGGSAIKLESIDGERIIVNGLINMNGIDTFSGSLSTGAGGSIWLRAKSIKGKGKLTADGGGTMRSAGGGGRIRFDFNNTLSYSGSINVRGSFGTEGGVYSDMRSQFGSFSFSSQLHDSNNYTYPSTWDINGSFGLAAGNYTILGDLNISRKDNARTVLVVKSSFPNNLTLNGEGVVLNVTGNVIIEDGSLIDGSGEGLKEQVGPGRGGTSQGGPHGGAGGGNTRAIYGNLKNPYSLGSGGDEGTGGGAVYIHTNGSVIINGKILVNGFNMTCTACASGAGGSIFIEANNITGNGTIDAGGGTFLQRGAGGGGLIALVANTITYDGLIKNDGGLMTAAGATGINGSGGTVYINGTASMNSTVNVTTWGKNGGNITIFAPLMYLEGMFNATSYDFGLTNGSINLSYSNCNSVVKHSSFLPNTTYNYNLGCVAGDATPPNATIIFPLNKTYGLA